MISNAKISVIIRRAATLRRAQAGLLGSFRAQPGRNAGDDLHRRADSPS